MAMTVVAMGGVNTGGRTRSTLFELGVYATRARTFMQCALQRLDTAYFV